MMMRKTILTAAFLLVMPALASAQTAAQPATPPAPAPDTSGSTAISVDCFPVDTTKPKLMQGMICRFRVWYPDRVEDYLQQMYLFSLESQPVTPDTPTPTK